MEDPMSDERVLLDVTDHVATVTLNRADKRNGLDLAMFEALIAAGERIAGDKRVRVVVLQGAGKVFCAGLDWGAFLAAGDAGQRLLARPEGSPANIAQRVGWIWQELEVPVICSLHGVAFGGGLQVALGADVRIAHPETQLSVMEIKYGLVPDMGATQTLLRLVRPDVAAELLYTGRVVLAPEAQSLGLVTRLADDPHAAARALARDIASKSPHAIRADKRLLRGAIGASPKESFLLETELQLGLLGTPNQMEAVQAAMTKRAPSFVDVD
jgi:enoyl-CoA hydratase/carnithine racemase